VRRAVLDPGVLVSALIAPTGTPAKLLGEARSGAFEMVASSLLLEELEELEEVLARDKFRRYVGLDLVGGAPILALADLRAALKASGRS